LIKLYHKLFSAIAFFSRLPVPPNIEFKFAGNGDAVVLLPVVGLVLSLIGSFLYSVMILYLPEILAIIFTLSLMILISGAIHEDGLADFFDGFGGGWEKKQILSIMTDSSIGTYGVLALLISFLSKIVIFNLLDSSLFIVTLILTSVISRGFAVSLMFDMDYVKKNEKSKAKGMTKKMSNAELIFILVFSLICSTIFNNYYILLIFPLLFLFRIYFKKKLMKKIGGYTGDCLGAFQQLSELVILIAVLIINHNSLMLKIF